MVNGSDWILNHLHLGLRRASTRYVPELVVAKQRTEILSAGNELFGTNYLYKVRRKLEFQSLNRLCLGTEIIARAVANAC